MLICIYTFELRVFHISLGRNSAKLLGRRAVLPLLMTFFVARFILARLLRSLLFLDGSVKRFLVLLLNLVFQFYVFSA